MKNIGYNIDTQLEYDNYDLNEKYIRVCVYVCVR